MTQPLDQCGLLRGGAWVRRTGPDGAFAGVIGTTMLVALRHLLVCAHVVAAANGHAVDAVVPSPPNVIVDLPTVMPGRLLRAHVELWWLRRLRRGSASEVASLALRDEPAANAETVRLVLVGGPW